MEILALILLVLAGGITLIALFAAVGLLLPQAVARVRQHLEASLSRPILLGLVNSLFAGLVVLLCLWGAGELSPVANGLLAGILTLIAIVVALSVLALTLLGMTALADFLGERMTGNQTFSSHLRGGSLLLLAALAPYVGWFVFAPLALWASFGAALPIVFRRVPAPEE